MIRVYSADECRSSLMTYFYTQNQVKGGDSVVKGEDKYIVDHLDRIVSPT